MNLTSRQIIRSSRSNLAFALAVLPRRKRTDMGVFYAFCRVIDDIADSPGLAVEDRISLLAHWRSLVAQKVDPEDGIECELAELLHRYSIKPETLDDIISGVEMDLTPRLFQSREDLIRYCYHVASAVGLVSIEIFGYQNPDTRIYAEKLGYALQWTNIMRDVGEDAGAGRIYLPLEDLDQFGIAPKSLMNGNFDPEKFRDLMELEASVARRFYNEAAAALPEEDRASMRSAELMHRIYLGIFHRMEEDGFQVFQKHYHLNRFRMLGEMLWARFL